MGEIIGGLIGGVGSLIGGNKAASAANQGFNYLKGSPVGTQYMPEGGAANSATADLLGVGGDPAKAKEAFNNYLGSTGYNFQLQQGQAAVNSNNASKGLLNSGATLKALTRFGQNLGSSAFNNYLTQLSGLATRGLQAGSVIGQAGTAGGATAANATAGGIGGAAGFLGNALGSLF